MTDSWNIFKLAIGPLNNKESCIQWAFQLNMIPCIRWCTRHRKNMILEKDAGLIGMFRCRGKNHDHRVSVAEDTWFERSRISPQRLMLLTYSFAIGWSYDQTIRETSIGSETTSRETVADRFSYCREVCMAALDSQYEKQGLIGGPGHVVEIDECKIGRRKYNRGRMVEGQWIVGMIDLNGDFRVEICPDNKRDRKTLADIIIKHVAPETVLYTDCWKGYDNIEDEGYFRLTVNHSYNFIDPDTLCDTQKIESQWRPIRKRLSRGGVRSQDLDMHLCEFLWRRDCKFKNKDLFLKLLEDIKILYPGKTQ